MQYGHSSLPPLICRGHMDCTGGRLLLPPLTIESNQSSAALPARAAHQLPGASSQWSDEECRSHNDATTDNTAETLLTRQSIETPGSVSWFYSTQWLSCCHSTRQCTLYADSVSTGELSGSDPSISSRTLPPLQIHADWCAADSVACDRIQMS